MQRLIDRDLLSAFALFCVYGLFSSGSSNDAKDWIFPNLASYIVLFTALFLTVKVLFNALMKRLPDSVQMSPDERTASIDVLVFTSVILVYMFVMYGFGFWLSSWLMLSLTSIYLTIDKTRHNIRTALIVSLGSCILFYFAFLYLFYVPFPRATWWTGFMPD
ncbi:MAG: tripartite tricarboxylate transporter TctB family protein [Rhodospirillales bacterium]